MKVNDLKRPKLKEGFIDNFISKIENMSGGDGVIGVLRALRGQNAALNKFADAIANATTPKVNERLGNQIKNIENKSAPIPIGMILKQAEVVGSAMAKREGISVVPAEIQSAITANKEDILKMLLAGDDTSDNILRSIFQSVVTRAPNTSVDVPFADSIRIVSLIVAGTIIFIKTTKEDMEDFKVDPADLEKFNAAGERVKEILFDPTSPDIRALLPNEDFKDHLHWLIIQIIKTVQQKYAVMDSAQLQALSVNPPALVSPIEFKSALSGHAAGVNPDAVNQVIAKATPAIQEQFKAWLVIAAKETAGGGPANESEHLYVEPWGASAMRLVDNMNFGPAPKAKPEATTPGKPEVVKIGSQEIKPNDPLYDKIMAAVNGTEE